MVTALGTELRPCHVSSLRVEQRAQPMPRKRTTSRSSLFLACLLLATDPTLLCRSTSAPYSSSSSSSSKPGPAAAAAVVGERRAKADPTGPQQGEMAASATALDFREMMRKERELMLKMARKDGAASDTSTARCLTRRKRPGLEPKYRVSSCGGGVDGIHYVPDFVTAGEGRLLEQAARNEGGGSDDEGRVGSGSGGGGGGRGEGGGEWKDLHNRRLQIHGGTPHPSGMVEEELPQFLREVCEALVAAGIFPENAPPNHVLLNEYSEGQGIGPHKDGPLYEGRVAILSLGSEANLDFWGSLEDARADCANIAAAAATDASPLTSLSSISPSTTSAASTTTSAAAAAAAAIGPAASDCTPAAVAATGSAASDSTTAAAAAERSIPRATGGRCEARSLRSLASVTCEDCSLVVFEGQAYHDVWHGIKTTGNAASTTPPPPPPPPPPPTTTTKPSGTLTAETHYARSIEEATAAAPTAVSRRNYGRGGGSFGGGDVGGAQKRLSFTLRRVARVVPADSVMEHPEARSEMERRRRGFERAVTETAVAET